MCVEIPLGQLTVKPPRCVAVRPAILNGSMKFFVRCHTLASYIIHRALCEEISLFPRFFRSIASISQP
jgi:hypothetical protein